MSEICRHFIVSGKVQGVFFRDSTCKKAQELNITGWVKNLDNGSVEVLACGSEAQMNLLAKWLWDGPPLAKVTNVVVEDFPVQKFTDFIVV